MVKTKIIKAVFLNILFLFILSLSGLVAGGAFADVIIDNGDTGTSFSGTWAVSGASGHYGADSLYSRDGTTYTWEFSPSASGDYEVFMWWTEWSSRSTSIPVDIEHAGGTAQAIINQQENGGQWNSLGEFSFNAGQSYTVTITSQPGPSSTCADAVRFLPVSETPADIIIDNRDVSLTSQTGTWDASGASGFYGEDSVWSRNGTTFSWHFNPSQTGSYELFMWWTEWASRSESVPVDIEHAGGTAQVIINQQENGGQWNSLGDYLFEFGQSYRVTITSQPNPSSTCADAVRFVSNEGAPSADFAADPLTGPVPLTVSFTDFSTGSVSSYEWDFNGDGEVDSTERNPSFTYDTIGNYTVKLTVSGPNGDDQEVKESYISVTDLSGQDLIIDNRDLETSQTGTWGVSGASGFYGADSVWSRNGTTFTWHFAPALTSNYELMMWWTEWPSRSNNIPVDIEHDGGTTQVTIDQLEPGSGGKWNSLGVFPFTLGNTYQITITSQAGPSSTCADAMRFISTTGDITAEFIADPLSGDSPLEVQFMDESVGPVESWAWDFNDDGTVDSTERSPSHTYEVGGSYTVKLTVTGQGGSDEEIKVDYIKVTESVHPPTADFTADPVSGQAPLTVQFTDASTGTVDSWAWDFDNDGTVDSTEPSPSHTYEAAGIYTVKLTVNGPGGSDDKYHPDYINVAEAPAYEVIIDNRDSETSQTGTWYVSGALGFYGEDSVWSRDGTTFTWHFSPEQTSHYEFFMWWTQWASRSASIPVDIEHAGGTTRVFINQQENGGKWNSLGFYHFEAGQSYRVIITSQPGPSSTCADAVKFASVEGETAADFTADPTSGPWPLNVQFTDKSTGAISSWAWDFDNDGTVDSTERNPSFTYETAGNYTVKLTVTGPVGDDQEIKTGYISVTNEVPEEHIYACWAYASQASQVTDMLQDIGAYKDGDIWRYVNVGLNKSYVIHIVEDVPGMIDALTTEGAHVIIKGHANYSLGPAEATPEEKAQEYIEDIYYIDDPKILNISSKTFAVSISGIKYSQAFPNWQPIFQDGTSGIMPFGFNDPRGNPPHNRYITYQVPGDPTYYKAETARNSAIEKFAGSGALPWYSSTGEIPDPNNSDDIPYFVVPSGYFETTGTWSLDNSVPGYYSTNYRYTDSGSGNRTASWLFKPPEPGNYRIYAWWPESSNNTSAAEYTVQDEFGSSTYALDQRTNGSQWNLIGEFSFDYNQYAVVLTDNSSGGNVIADAVRISHADNPPDVVAANFRGYTRYGATPLSVRFGNQSTGDVTSYLWDFGDGNTSTSSSPTHTYAAPGYYDVTLTVSGPAGSDVITKYDYVHAGQTSAFLQAEFSNSSPSGQEETVGNQVTFTDRSIGSIVSWAWDFDGNGSIDSTEQSPTYVYTAPGTYTVSLTVTDSDNNSHTEIKEDYVHVVLYNQIIDNRNTPYYHYGSRTILFRQVDEIPPDQLRYSRLFYESCSTGPYYLETFNRGIVFYTLSSAGGYAAVPYLRAYMVEGKSDYELWRQSQDLEPKYDYYNFNKYPWEQ
jgi:PKD repeat protein